MSSRTKTRGGDRGGRRVAQTERKPPRSAGGGGRRHRFFDVDADDDDDAARASLERSFVDAARAMRAIKSDLRIISDRVDRVAAASASKRRCGGGG